MKALIAAGGHGTRLRPITYSVNKHLFPIANKPMIEYALERISETGIKEVAININKDENDIKEVVGDGSRWNLNVCYLEQKGGALGLAHVIKNAKDWIGEDDLLFYLGDNIVSSPIVDLVEKFKKEQLDCLLFLVKVKDPQRFGVPVIENGKIVKVEEKPLNPQSDLAVAGIYLYSNKIIEAVENIKPSDRGELEISDAHTYLIKNKAKVNFDEITGWWKDTGKPEDLLEANSLVLERMISSDIKSELAEDTAIKGRVIIDKNVKIGKKVILNGPLIIGEGSEIENVVIDPDVSIGKECLIKDTKIKNTIVCEGARIIGYKQGIKDSLIGKECRIAGLGESVTGKEQKFLLGSCTVIE